MTKDQAIARALFETPCFGKTDKYHGGNCVRCCLRGEGKPNTADGKGQEPNYAGWARIYVQAEATIPAKFRKAFLEQLRYGAKANASYNEMLWQDIYQYGVNIEGV